MRKQLIGMFGLLLLAGTAQGQATRKLQSETLNVAVKTAPPFVIKKENGGYGGISIVLWERIAKNLQLDYWYRETDLDSLLAGVAQGRFDVGVGALTVTAGRETHFDFSQPFFTSGLGIAVATGDAPGWWLVTKRLFSPAFLSAALALIGVLLLAGFLVWLFERHKNPEQFGGKPHHGIGAGFWWAAVTMTTVGYGDKAPATVAGRLVGVVWMFAAVIIISSFTASIASSLTVGKLQTQIHGPADLPDVRVGSLSDSTSAAYLRGRNIDFLIFGTTPDALNALAVGKLDAVVYDAPLLHYWIQESNDDAMVVLPGIFEEQEYALALPEGSDIQEEINRALLTITASAQWEGVLKQYLGASYNK